VGYSRRIPARLGEKLAAVRSKLGCSFAEMADKLSDDADSVSKSHVHQFENGKLDPPLVILLRYSKLARVKMEIFADDSKDLPW
jgi:transcriptional regulator with XRE-family HTH domain